MKMNMAGIELVKRFEGCRLTAYKDAVGILTIGYGHTSMAGGLQVEKGQRITAFEAEEILIADLATFELAVIKKLDRTPNDNQFAAMVSLCFNIGPTAFARSTVCKAFNAGKLDLAGGAFLMWVKAGGRKMPGLVRRRKAERELFLS